MTAFDPANPDFDLPTDPADRERWRRLVASRVPAHIHANRPSTNGASSDCPSEMELAAWIDGGIDGSLDDSQRALIESHLASCSVCMKAMLEVRRVLESQGDAIVFVAPEILAAAKVLMSPAQSDVGTNSGAEIHIVRHLRFARWMNVARWSGAAAASVVIGVIGWQAGQATNMSSAPIADTTVANARTEAGDRDLLVNELSLGALGGGDFDDEDDFSLLSLSMDDLEGNAS